MSDTQDIIQRVQALAKMEATRGASIETLNLRRGAYRALQRAGIQTVGDMVDMIDQDPLAIQRRTRNFGLIGYANALDALYKVIPSREHLMKLCLELSDALQEEVEKNG